MTSSVMTSVINCAFNFLSTYSNSYAFTYATDATTSSATTTTTAAASTSASVTSLTATGYFCFTLLIFYAVNKRDLSTLMKFFNEFEQRTLEKYLPSNISLSQLPIVIATEIPIWTVVSSGVDQILQNVKDSADQSLLLVYFRCCADEVLIARYPLVIVHSMPSYWRNTSQNGHFALNWTWNLELGDYFSFYAHSSSFFVLQMRKNRWIRGYSYWIHDSRRYIVHSTYVHTVLYSNLGTVWWRNTYICDSFRWKKLFVKNCNTVDDCNLTEIKKWICTINIVLTF